MFILMHTNYSLTTKSDAEKAIFYNNQIFSYVNKLDASNFGVKA